MILKKINKNLVISLEKAVFMWYYKTVIKAEFVLFVFINERKIKMSIWGIVLGVLLAIVSVAIIVVIILQEGNQQGIGAVTGVADSYFSKNKARSIDAFLSRWTKVFAAIFVIFVIALNVLSKFGIL